MIFVRTSMDSSVRRRPAIKPRIMTRLSQAQDAKQYVYSYNKKMTVEFSSMF